MFIYFFLEYERLKAMHKVDGAITVNTTFHSNPPEHTLTTNQEQQQQPDQYEETTDEDGIYLEFFPSKSLVNPYRYFSSKFFVLINRYRK